MKRRTRLALDAIVKRRRRETTMEKFARQILGYKLNRFQEALLRNLQHNPLKAIRFPRRHGEGKSGRFFGVDFGSRETCVKTTIREGKREFEIIYDEHVRISPVLQQKILDQMRESEVEFHRTCLGIFPPAEPQARSGVELRGVHEFGPVKIPPRTIFY